MFVDMAPFKGLGDSKAQAVKVVEEASELLYAVAHGSYADVLEEWGDVMQALVNLAEAVGIDTDEAVRGCNERNASRGRL